MSNWLYNFLLLSSNLNESDCGQKLLEASQNSEHEDTCLTASAE